MSFMQKTNYTLAELVDYKKSLEVEAAKSGESVPDGVVEMAEVATQLLAGKVDQAARFRAGLEAHIEATKSQLSHLVEMLDVTESLMKDAVKVSGSNRIDGQVYSMRIQNNSRASVIIDADGLIPLEHLKVSLSMGDKYSDEQLMFYASIVLGRPVEMKKDMPEFEAQKSTPFYRLELTKEERDSVESSVTISVSKSSIESALKKDAASVPGARLERGTHLRVEAGKAKTKTKELPNG